MLGGGATPNAGLRAPTHDSDGLTDVYLSAPKNDPSFDGGVVYPDVSPWRSSYIFMTPDMSRGPFRFRAGHEFMHVIQSAYAYSFSDGPLAEGFANWAAAWAMPDINPLDSNFFGDQSPGSAHPWTPLDCETDQCGSGYWQWMFIQDQVEAYGPGFVTGYYERYAANAAPPHVWDSAYWLDLEIKAVTGGSQSLSTRFGAYAGDVWDPARWAKDSLRILRDQYGIQPPAYTYQLSSTTDSGTQSLTIDHLAVRYVRLRNETNAYSGPGSQIEISWQRPDGMASPVIPLVKYSGHDGWTNAAGVGGTQGTFMVSADPGQVDEVVLPLVNDSLTADNEPFSYRVQVIAPVVPASSSSPHVSGKPAVGQTLSSTAGSWTGTQPISISYQWQRCLGRRCVDVPGATRNTRKLAAADAGSKMRMLVAATNAAGRTRAASKQLGPVLLSASSVKSALSKALIPRTRDKDAKIGQLLSKGSYALSFAAPSAGSLTISWYEVPRGAHLARARAVLVATARATISRARAIGVVCKLTKQGRQILTGATRVVLTATGTFTPRGLSAITATRTFALSR